MILGPLGAAHMSASILALALGAIVLALHKGTDLHRLFGMGYVVAMVAVNVTALGLYRLTGRFGPFHALALLSLAVTAWGALLVIRRRNNWMARHLQAMSYSYLGLLAAASTEALLRLRIFGFLSGDPTAVISIGVLLAIVFAIAGTLVIPRWTDAALPKADSR
jgi:uncharacterized membrane protein